MGDDDGDVVGVELGFDEGSGVGLPNVYVGVMVGSTLGACDGAEVGEYDGFVVGP